jgi:predicted DNA-binding transcriptional regulator YafY
LKRNQKHKWLDTTTFEVKIKVILNYELERLILSYGESVKVVAPQILKEKIKERLLKGWENY